AHEGCCFAFGSCQFPAGMMDRELANASFRALGRRFPGGAQLPTRLLLLGDQVYTDATYGLLDPVRLDDRYRAPYEALTARDGPMGQLPQDMLRVIRRTPDDHEIQDDWEPGRNGADGKYSRGVSAYWRYQRGEKESDVDDAAPRTGAAPPPRKIWFTEEQRTAGGAGWRLFMADSRTVRQFRDEKTVNSALILGEDQTVDLMRWLLGSPRDDLKIVTSAAMLLPRTRMHLDEPLHLDNWQGYPASLYSLLVLLCENEMRNVVFLSGDEHIACSATVAVSHPASGKSCTFHSHHAPPLYAPYPFANASRHDFLRQDTFDFQWEHDGAVRHYRCTVDAQFPDATRQGYGLLHAEPGAAGWDLRYEVVSSA
ncbi:MAG TPA: alkaline phosphatase D family protein, partial [Ramlibacter sp.]|nr:alkaline phosphatase D family protein [Ramlibacter sp.]